MRVDVPIVRGWGFYVTPESWAGGDYAPVACVRVADRYFPAIREPGQPALLCLATFEEDVPHDAVLAIRPGLVSVFMPERDDLVDVPHEVVSALDRLGVQPGADEAFFWWLVERA